jgi:hypothetical protein
MDRRKFTGLRPASQYAESRRVNAAFAVTKTGGGEASASLREVKIAIWEPTGPRITDGCCPWAALRGSMSPRGHQSLGQLADPRRRIAEVELSTFRRVQIRAAGSQDRPRVSLQATHHVRARELADGLCKSLAGAHATGHMEPHSSGKYVVIALRGQVELQLYTNPSGPARCSTCSRTTPSDVRQPPLSGHACVRHPEALDPPCGMR